LSLKLAARLISPFIAKIANITHADTADHILDLSAFIPKETIAILVVFDRLSGIGSMLGDPNSQGVLYVLIGDGDTKLPLLFPIKNQELKYALSVSGDDWDLYLLGYFVQKRTR